MHHPSPRAPRCPAWRTAAAALSAALALAACGAPSSKENLASVRADTLIEFPATELELPGLPAANDYDTLELDWTDAARGRAVPALLYWPKAAESEVARPVPLIVFSHGIGGSRYGYSYLGRYWASHGYASLHVQHIGSDRSVWGSNVLQTALRMQDAAQEKEAVARVADLHFALDSLLASERGPHIDRQRLVVAGHSYGANTALLAAGATVQRGGKAMQFRDPRFTAAIVMSAPPFYGDNDFGPILGGVSIPTLHVTATLDTIEIPGYYSPMSDRLKVFDATGSKLKVLAVFQGGSHSVFTDRMNTGGVNAPRMKTATQALSMAFLRRVFEGSDDALAAWNAYNRRLVSSYVSR
ncbi:MAG TPA: hypothetical protein VLA16_12925 [Ideonella sp.]|nr:hypothetical protein [Ideonella sp.]